MNELAELGFLPQNSRRGILNKELTFSGIKIWSLCQSFAYFLWNHIKNSKWSSHSHICYSYEHTPGNLVYVLLQRKLDKTAITLYSTNGLTYKPGTCVLFTVNEVYISNTEYENEILMGHLCDSRAIWRGICNMIYFLILSKVVLVGINRAPNKYSHDCFLQFLISHVLWDLEQLFSMNICQSFWKLCLLSFFFFVYFLLDVSTLT